MRHTSCEPPKGTPALSSPMRKVYLNLLFNLIIFAEFVGKVTGDVCNCKTLIEINKQKRLHPGQSSEDLCQLLLKFGNTLHLKITRLNDKVFDLEYPLREYIEWTENGVVSWWFPPSTHCALNTVEVVYTFRNRRSWANKNCWNTSIGLLKFAI